MISVSGCEYFHEERILITDTRCLTSSFVDWEDSDIENGSDRLIDWAFKHNAKLCHCDWIKLDKSKIEFCAEIAKELGK